jgi:hypothetical protein
VDAPGAPGVGRDKEGFGVTPVAALTYSRETSLMFGAAGIFFYKPPAEKKLRNSQLQIVFAYSVKHQFASQTKADLYLFDDRLYLFSALNFLVFPDSFFGVGNATRTSDEEAFTPRVWEFNLSPQLQVVKNLYVGPWFRFEDTRILEVEEGGRIDRGDVPGSEGGREIALGVAASYDTRDNTLYPQRGTFCQFFMQVSDPAFGADFRTSRSKLDYRRYFPMPAKDHVLAFQALGRFMSGDPPFFGLSRLGGDKTLRGHLLGRYRDRQYVAAQAEYRLPLVWRLGGVGFAGAGDVAHDLDDYRPAEFKTSVGGGLRLNVSDKDRVHVRADFGYTGDDYNVYVNVGEAF